jgi:KDO2-lipid IV(A) lauroyltransferase
MEKTGYYLFRSFTWILQRFPLWFLYLISNLFYYVAYYIIRYRRKTVTINLANSFPGKTKQQRDLIAKKFYSHFCDTVFETLYFDWMSEKEARRRIIYVNPELLNGYLNAGKQVVAFCGHYNNWEWFSDVALVTSHRIYAVYKKIKNPSFERFYYNLRSRFGSIPLERSDTFKQLYSDHQQGIPSMSAFVFDQTPRKYEIRHWITFLNQDTPVVLGAEKIAQKLDTIVIFLYSRKIRRGFYEVEFRLVTDKAKSLPQYEITDTCSAILEQQILDNPEYWLWSHKRWKHKKTQSL